MLSISRYHDFSAGHRVCGHENACAHLHGHNYRVTFHCTGLTDHIGRVIDFSVVKQRLCQWLEDHWDHKMILWEKDPLLEPLIKLDPKGVLDVSFNPTAENMALYLLNVIGPGQLAGTGVTLSRVQVMETRKCGAEASR